MDNWLIAHAIDNAWQRPNIDGLLIIEPNRITPATGAIGFVRDGNTSISLPKTGWWHAFTIDKLHMNYGNLNIPSNAWIRLSAIVNTYSCWMLLYNVDGRTFPLTQAYIYKNSAGSLLLALPATDRYKWLETDELYFKIYPGYTAPDTVQNIFPTFVEYFETPNGNAIKTALDRYSALKAQKVGYVSFWINGQLLLQPTSQDIKVWDDVEIRVDGRVKRVVDFRCGDLRTFQSTLDLKRKYLLHIPKQSGVWTFNNDVELEIFYGREGRYYHTHRHMAIRQLTFNDLSMPTERIALLRNAYSTPVTDIDDMIIRLTIREDELDITPIYNSAHTHDLYRLSDEQIIDALVGANSNVPEWQAAALEDNSFNRLAAAKYKNITRDLCTDAYGYNAVTRYSADTPQRLQESNGIWWCRLPHLHATSSVIYEYDENGVLLGHYPNINNTVYRGVNPACRIVEAVAGQASDAVNITDNAPDFTIAEGENVGLWLRVVKSGVPTNEYTEAIEGTDYTRTGNAIVWLVDRTRRWPTVVHDDIHLFFTQTVDAKEGNIRVPILGRSVSEPMRTLWVPMETVEVWLNGHPLVFGIDFVLSWPEIVVVSKVWMNDGNTNTVAIRCRGVTGTTRVPQTGFVSSGLLSNNNKFDVRDDKVIRIVGGGMLLLREEVVFREDNTVGTNIVPDGFPYSVDDPTIPLRTLVTGNTYTLRDEARELDERIENYMSAWFPTPPPVNPVPLPGWYHLFSPLLNKLIWDYKNHYLQLVEDDPEHRISTTQLDRIMLGYKDLLKFDPAYIGYDKVFVKIHPHSLYSVVELDELGFAFIDRVNARYLNNAVQINQYLKIKGGK